MLQQIVRQADEWQPDFIWVNDSALCADMINKPHEDYPMRVDVTKEMIDTLVEYMQGYGIKELQERDIKQIHSTIMPDLHVSGRSYRVSDDIVVAQTFKAVAHEYLPELMDHILPVRIIEEELSERERYNNPNLIKNEFDLVRWYSIFETIHPFDDGNGRVGGTVIGVLSYLMENRYLAPLQ
jgi:Fic family protein